MENNGLKSTLLRTGQLIKIEPIGTSLVEPVEYIVKKGDCLIKIAKAYNVSVNDIQKANKIDGSRIYVGQKIIIVKH